MATTESKVYDNVWLAISLGVESVELYESLKLNFDYSWELAGEQNKLPLKKKLYEWNGVNMMV